MDLVPEPQVRYTQDDDFAVYKIMKKTLILIGCITLLSGCGQTQATNTDISDLSLTGTIVENPAHLIDQPSYMLVDTGKNQLLAYIESSEVSLGDFVEREGTAGGVKISQSEQSIPTIKITNFTPSKSLTEEDILLSTMRRESRKEPYSYNWNQNTSMLILQRDSSNGSAQAQIQDGDHKYLVSLVKNSNDWHIADIKEVAYSSEENPSSTGSTTTPSIP